MIKNLKQQFFNLLKKNTKKLNLTKKIEKVRPPSLLHIQKKSYNNFLYSKKPFIYSLHNSIKNFFPIKNSLKTILLKYKGYELKNPTHTLEECKLYSLTYSASLELHLQICVKAEKEKKTIYKKNQNVYICEIPLMTNEGSFIINGTERVIISQMCRAPGAYFFLKEDKNKKQYSLEIIPYKGVWLEFIIKQNNDSFIKINKKKKIPLAIFLYALKNFKQKTLKHVFCLNHTIIITKKKKLLWEINEDCLNTLSPFTIRHKKKYICKKNELIENTTSKNLFEKKYFQIKKSDLLNKILVTPILNNTLITKKLLKILLNNDEIIEKKITIANNDTDCYVYLTTTLFKQTYTEKKKQFCNQLTDLHTTSLIYIHNLLKQEEITTEKKANKFFQNLFFNENYYCLSSVGRDKINKALNIKDKKDKINLLDKNDILALVSKLFKIKKYYENNENIKYENLKNKYTQEFLLDDIDHIGNKRLKHVGELLYNQITTGLNKIKKITQEKLTSIETNKLQPKKALATTTPLVILIKEFFCSSQFSQFMDQNNPLSSITHKRRITTTGPGGLTKNHASIKARDVHLTNYGRICPIETPEGKNIGLVNSLALFAKINKNGLLKTPYRKIINRKPTNHINYLTAHEEDNYKIIQNTTLLKKKNYIAYRYFREFKTSLFKKMDYCDISTYQILSIATALIPFVEHNDANRALMGSNMQRQAVPLIKPDIPYIKAGLENTVGKESFLTISSDNIKKILYIDTKKITVEKKNFLIKITNPTLDAQTIWLKKYHKSNQNTSINQKPNIRKNNTLKKKTIIVDSSTTINGNLAIGKNILVAFMPWYGYNYEDSIVVSQDLVKKEKLTSINIEELECIVKETKLGKEKITKELPNVSIGMTKKLNKNGIIKEGTFVKTGDILVGKITPIGEIKSTPEEKLLKAIFGEKVDVVQNTSLIVPNGVYGTVSKIIILTKNKKQKKNVYFEEKKREIKTEAHRDWEIQQNSIIKKIFFLMKIYNKSIHNKNLFSTMPLKELQTKITNFKILDSFLKLLKNIYADYGKNNKQKIKSMEKRVGTPTNILKIIKIHITTKRNLQPGDKLSGRHGNKGVVSTIVPTEDMPHLENGTPVEMILNPLSIPSRMNIGQLFETHLSFTLLNTKFLVKKKNITTESYPFNGIDEKIIKNMLKINKLPTTGQISLIDGKIGITVHNNVTVGHLYMLKLNHLVDDKLHARCVGPYNIITQQPLGGKAQFGGQRFGEMEVWALEAFGAAHTLQELLTVKSDDLLGRVSTFKNIINGHHTIDTTIPESFLVLQKELFALGLNLHIEYK